MHSFGEKVGLRITVRNRRPLQRATAPPLQQPPHPSITQYSELSTSQWRPTSRLASRGAFDITRASAPGDLGPGCYVLKTAKSNSIIAHALLRREALVASQINHPSLIPVLAVECETAVPRLVLPYLEGITLRRLLDSSPRLSVSYALCVVRQIAAALAGLHAARWLHGQVRPEHIILSPQGHATLIDLTHARRLEGRECDTNGTLPAAPTYAAPETTSFHGCLTAASDIYSLGIVLYEALTGQPPFQIASPHELMRFHRRTAPPDLRAFRPDASLEVRELCHRLLAKEPLRRPAASQVVQWLTELEIEELCEAGF